MLSLWQGLIREARSRGRTLHQFVAEMRGGLAEIEKSPDYAWMQAEWVQQELSVAADPNGTMFLASDVVKLIKKALRLYGPQFFAQESALRSTLEALFVRSLACPADALEIGKLTLDIRLAEKRLR